MRTNQLGRGALVTVVLSATALLMSALVFTAAPAQAAGTDLGRVRGEILGIGGSAVDISWASLDGGRSGTKRATGGAYSLTLPAGTYRLTASDRRPTYDVSKRAPATVEVTVSAGSTASRSIRLVTGASIGGTVRAGGKVAPKARVVAARADQTVFTSTADNKGNFALGGLPAGAYSVFTYDARGGYTAKSLYLPRLKAGTYKPVDIRLGTRAGSLLVDVYAGNAPATGGGYATAVSRTTGQFWVAKVSRGTVTFKGVHPGRYRVIVPGSGDFLGTTANLSQKVRPGRSAFGTVRLTQEGASVTGTLVDANRPENPLPEGQVRLYDGRGSLLATATTRDDGTFRLGGQVTTRDDLTVVAGPGPYTDYLGDGLSQCRYTELKVSAVRVTTGETTSLGTLGLPHLPDSKQPSAQCHTPAPTSPSSTPGASGAGN